MKASFIFRVKVFRVKTRSAIAGEVGFYTQKIFGLVESNLGESWSGK
jgi:hypothetical protein